MRKRYGLKNNITNEVYKTMFARLDQIEIQKEREGFIWVEIPDDFDTVLELFNIERYNKININAVWDKINIISNGEEATLSGLPIPCTVYIDYKNSIKVMDGIFEFSASTPGYYHIKIDEPGYLLKEWIIDVD